MRARKPPEVCPVCDANVPPDAKACPECGACYESGWKEEDDNDEEEIDYDALDLPDDVYDEEDRRAVKAKSAKKGIPARWRWIALTLVVLWLAWFWWSRGSFRPW
jgi:hypothetical protein